MTADLQYERRATRGVDAQRSCPHELITVTPLIPSPQEPHTVSGKQLRVSHTCTDFLLPSTRKSTSFHVMHPQGLILFSN